MSVGGNTLFLTRTDGKKIVAPLNDCDESVYTGILTIPPSEISGSVCGFASADISWHLQRRENDNVFVNFQHPVGDTATIHIKSRVARSKTKLLEAPGSHGFFFAPIEMLKQSIIDNTEALDSSNFPQEIMVEHSFLGHGNRQWDTDIKDYDLEVGVESKIGSNIDYHADIHYNRYEYFNTDGTYIHGSIIKAAVENGDYDIQDPLSETADHKTSIGESGLQRDVKRSFHHIETTLALDGLLFEILDNKLT